LSSLDLSIDDSLGIREGDVESGVKSVESVLSDDLLGLSGLGAGVLDGGGSGNLAGFLVLGLEGHGSVGVGVESLHHVSVLEGVLLGLIVSSNGSLDGTELGLNLIRVDNSSEIGALHGGTVEVVSSLLNSDLVVGTEDGIKGGEGLGSVDNESTDVTTGGEHEEVKSVDVASVNSGQVTGVSGNVGIVVVVDDQGSLSHGESGVSHLTLSVSDGLGGTDSGEIGTTTDGGDSGEHGTGGLSRVDIGNKGELGARLNSVSSGENERGTSGGSEGGGNGVSLLVGVNLSVPLSPGTEGGEHASLSAHVTEGGLSSSGGTGSGNSGNTSDSTSSSPGLSRVLVTLLPEDSVSLSSVLSHVGVAEGDEIVSDGGREDSGHGGGTGNGSSSLGGSVGGDGGAGGHSKSIELTN